VTCCSKASHPQWILRAAACDQGGKHQCSVFVSTFARRYQLCGHHGFRYTAYLIELREPSKDFVSFQQGLHACTPLMGPPRLSSVGVSIEGEDANCMCPHWGPYFNVEEACLIGYRMMSHVWSFRLQQLAIYFIPRRSNKAVELQDVAIHHHSSCPHQLACTSLSQ
jgi:hypothetical protein